jgi:DNA-binding phage protein
MGKAKTSSKHQTYLENLSKADLRKVSGLHKSNPIKELTNKQQVSLAIFECLLNNDPEGVMEMIEVYLEAVNKAKLRRETKLSKSTMYSALKHRNPTVKTLAKIMSASTH